MGGLGKAGEEILLNTELARPFVQLSCLWDFCRVIWKLITCTQRGEVAAGLYAWHSMGGHSCGVGDRSLWSSVRCECSSKVLLCVFLGY